jgi:hypothetical protein
MAQYRSTAHFPHKKFSCEHSVIRCFTWTLNSWWSIVNHVRTFWRQPLCSLSDRFHESNQWFFTAKWPSEPELLTNSSFTLYSTMRKLTRSFSQWILFLIVDADSATKKLPLNASRPYLVSRFTYYQLMGLSQLNPIHRWYHEKYHRWIEPS